jgi:hypothetical protein
MERNWPIDYTNLGIGTCVIIPSMSLEKFRASLSPNVDSAKLLYNALKNHGAVKLIHERS